MIAVGESLVTKDDRYSIKSFSNSTHFLSMLDVNNLDFQEKTTTKNTTFADDTGIFFSIAHKYFMFFKGISCEIAGNWVHESWCTDNNWKTLDVTLKEKKEMSKDKIYFDCIRHVDDVTPINGFITRPDYMGVYYSSYTEVNENGNIVDDQYESQRYTHKAKLIYKLIYAMHRYCYLLSHILYVYLQP